MVGGSVVGGEVSVEVTCDQTCHFATARGRGFTSFFSYLTIDPFPYELSGKTLHLRFADTFTRLVIYPLFVGISSDQP